MIDEVILLSCNHTIRAISFSNLENNFQETHHGTSYSSFSLIKLYPHARKYLERLERDTRKINSIGIREMPLSKSEFQAIGK